MSPLVLGVHYEPRSGLLLCIFGFVLYIIGSADGEFELLVPREDPQHLDMLLLPETNLILVASVVEPLRAANRIAGRTLYTDPGQRRF
jgi:hypothetical protein